MKRVASKWAVAGIAVALVVALAPAGFAESPIAGKWKIEVDFAGTPVPADLEVIENDDGSLKGTLTSVQGEMELEKIVYEGNAISFEQEVDMGGTPMIFKFAGTVDGDAVSGTLTSDMGEMAVTGVRGGADGPGIVGVWDVTSDSQLGELKRTLTIKDDMTGSYASEDASWDISNLKAEAGKVEFDVTVDVQGQELPLHFVGTLDGNSLKGDFMADGSSVSVVTAARKSGGLDAFKGQWDVLVASQIGDFNHTITFANEGGTYKSEEGESELTNLEVNGNEIKFSAVVKAAGAEYPLDFTGALEEGKLIGDFWMDGGSVAEVTGTRGGLVTLDKLAGKWNLEIDSPLGLLEHVLIVPAEGAVTYDQEGTVSEVTDFKIEGGQVHYGVNIQGYEVTFIGTLEGNELKGDYHMDGNPVASVIGVMGEA